MCFSKSTRGRWGPCADFRSPWALHAALSSLFFGTRPKAPKSARQPKTGLLILKSPRHRESAMVQRLLDGLTAAHRKPPREKRQQQRANRDNPGDGGDDGDDGDGGGGVNSDSDS